MKSSFSPPPLGCIIDKMNISSSALARRIHVDASLVSKWKRGARVLSSRSPYFDGVVDFILEESSKTDNAILKDILRDFFPKISVFGPAVLRKCLSDVLSGKVSLNREPQAGPFIDNAPIIPVQILTGNVGKRRAAETILAEAENMKSPGNLIFIDSEEYTWLLEDKNFAKNFVKRIDLLLKRGFNTSFVVHFSSYKDRLVQFFELCNILLFHRNAHWYYYEYYDEDVFRFSAIILGQSVCALGIMCPSEQSIITVLTDSHTVYRYRQMAESTITRCQNLFPFSGRIDHILDYIEKTKTSGSLYAYLPAPAFISATPDLLTEILRDNSVEGEDAARCIYMNRIMRQLAAEHASNSTRKNTKYVQIFQKEEMQRRVRKQPFVSCSLSILTGKDVLITKKQYAGCLRNLIDELENNDSIEAAFFSKYDNIPLPHYPEMNCWCKKNTWMIQMDRKGFRLSEETSIVNAASITFERSLRKIPPSRKEKSSVIAFLNQFIEEELEKNEEEN